MKKILLAALAALAFTTPAVANDRPNFGFSIELGTPRSHEYRGYQNRYRPYENREFVRYNGQRYRLVPKRYHCPEDTTPIRVDYRGFICVDEYDYERGGYDYRNR